VPPANRSYAQELARNVDAFFPSMNTFDTISRHGLRAPTEATEDGRLAAGTPVFFYLWPQYATVPHELGPPESLAVRAALAAGTGIRRTARLVGTGNATVARIAAEMRGG